MLSIMLSILYYIPYYESKSSLLCVDNRRESHFTLYKLSYRSPLSLAFGSFESLLIMVCLLDAHIWSIRLHSSDTSTRPVPEARPTPDTQFWSRIKTFCSATTVTTALSHRPKVSPLWFGSVQLVSQSTHSFWFLFFSESSESILFSGSLVRHSSLPLC